MKVKIKKLSDKAVIPTKAHEGDAGLDLVATSSKINSEKGYISYGTDLAIEIPKGYMGLIFPRSSISNYHLSLTNSIGLIDENYRGELTLRFKKSTLGRGVYEVGDKIGQLVIIPYPEIELEEVDELEESVRNADGFGSSGN